MRKSTMSLGSKYDNPVNAKLASIKLWAATAACLVLSATLLPVAGNGSLLGGSGVENADPQSCTAGCYDKYYTCIVSGKGTTYCQSQLQWCLSGCGGSARIAE